MSESEPDKQKKALDKILGEVAKSSEDIDVSIEEDAPRVPAKRVEDSIKESPAHLLSKTADWAAKGGSLDLSSADGLRHLLAESRDRASMFNSILSLHRMQRIAKLVNITEKLEDALFHEARIPHMETMELLQALKHADTTVKQLVDFIDKATEDSATGAQILINMIDARSVTLDREDVPHARSREIIRNAVLGLLNEFEKPDKKGGGDIDVTPKDE